MTPPDHVDEAAHRLEHLRTLDPELEESVAQTAEDPHGKPIPGGDWPFPLALALPLWPGR